MRNDLWRRRTRILAAIVILAACVLAAWTALHNGLRNELRSWYYADVLGTPLIAGQPRTPIDCRTLQQPGVMVVLVAGQSNSANYGETRLIAREGVFDFHRNRCYRARDPMLGAQGGGGSVWPRLGNLLVADKPARKVVFSSIGVGSTTIDEWAPGGSLHPGLLRAVTELRDAGFEITHFLWQQGETDALRSTAGGHYAAKFRALLSALRGAGLDAPVYVAIASYCNGSQSEAVRSAQRLVVNPALGVLPGPDTDKFRGADLRYDDCHFSAAGLDIVARAWFAELRPKAAI